MPHSSQGFGTREPSHPAASEPKMLNSPIRASTVEPTQAGSPLSARKAGMCVAMNTTWKPQTKKPRARSQKPRSDSARRAAWPAVGPAAAAFAAPTCLSIKAPNASGSISDARADISTRVCAQPRLSIRRRAPGSIANWPSEPSAMATPNAIDRFSAGRARLTAPKTMGMVVPASPRPTSTPAASVNVALAVAAAMPSKPSR